MTANEREKERAGVRRGLAAAASIVFHLVLFLSWPERTVPAPEVGSGTVSLQEIVMVDLPSAEAILPPSLPDFVPILVPEVDIPVLPLAAIENMALPELPMGSFASVSAPGTPGVLPLLLNPAECEAALRERFPATLEGLELNVESILQVYVDEMGRVGGVQLRTSSGFPELDLIAQQVVREVARFRYATDAAGRPTPVWVGIPMGFENVFVAGTPSSFRSRGHFLTRG